MPPPSSWPWPSARPAPVAASGSCYRSRCSPPPTPRPSGPAVLEEAALDTLGGRPRPAVRRRCAHVHRHAAVRGASQRRRAALDGTRLHRDSRRAGRRPAPIGRPGPISSPTPPASRPSPCATPRRCGTSPLLTADFRDQYYGLAPFVSDDHDGAALVTCGLIDVGRSAWGERPARFARARYEAPRVDVAALTAADAKLRRVGRRPAGAQGARRHPDRRARSRGRRAG